MPPWLESIVEQQKEKMIQKKPDKLLLPTWWPDIINRKKWQSQVTSAFINSSRYSDDREVGWLNEVFKPKDLNHNLDPSTQFEAMLATFADSGEERFKRDDGVAVDQLIKILPVELKMDVEKYKTRLFDREDKMMKSRQILWFIENYFKTNDHTTTHYTVEHAQNLPWYGDSELQIKMCLERWDTIMDYLDHKDHIKADYKRELFAQKIAQSQVLKVDYEDWKRYEYLNDDSKEKYTYEYLRKMVQCYLLRCQSERQKGLQQQALNNTKTAGKGNRAIGAVGTATPSVDGGKRGRSRARSCEPGAPPRGSSPGPSRERSQHRVCPMKDATTKDLSQICLWHLQGKCMTNPCPQGRWHGKVKASEQKQLEEMVAAKRNSRNRSDGSVPPGKGKGKGKKGKGKSDDHSKGSAPTTPKGGGKGKGKKGNPFVPPRSCKQHWTVAGCDGTCGLPKADHRTFEEHQKLAAARHTEWQMSQK